MGDEGPVPCDNRRVRLNVKGNRSEETGNSLAVHQAHELLPIGGRRNNPVQGLVWLHEKRLRQWRGLKAILPHVLQVALPGSQLGLHRLLIWKAHTLDLRVGMNHDLAVCIDDVDVSGIRHAQCLEGSCYCDAFLFGQLVPAGTIERAE